MVRERPETPVLSFRFSENNFDLIRLVAAAEVAVRHTLVHMAPDSFGHALKAIFALVPGVPIFFFLSGYLISRSWERSLGPREYFRNRALRLFPALWVCVLISTALLFASGFMSNATWRWPTLLAWVAGQGTVLQFWTPEFLRSFGVGALNGSLWSVSVEIQFYVVTAVLYIAMRRLPAPWQTATIGVLAVLFTPFNSQRAAIEGMLEHAAPGSHLAQLFGVSFLPWYFMFLCGAYAQRISDRLVPICVERWREIVAMYVLAMLVDFHLWGLPLGNEIPAYLVPMMGVATLALAYVGPGLSRRLLGGMDVSYGLYIYHMPIVNVVLYLGFISGLPAVLAALACSVACAVLSWRVVERPFLRRKLSALRPQRS
jgi:peptidoglycan/LPS O-acetylase OafA/YrhL